MLIRPLRGPAHADESVDESLQLRLASPSYLRHRTRTYQTQRFSATGRGGLAGCVAAAADGSTAGRGGASRDRCVAAADGRDRCVEAAAGRDRAGRGGASVRRRRPAMLGSLLSVPMAASEDPAEDTQVKKQP